MSERARRVILGAMLGVFLAWPSFDLIRKYLGDTGGWWYLVAVAGGCLWLTARFDSIRARLNRISEPSATWIGAGTLIVFVLGFAWIYPAADAGVSPPWLAEDAIGRGSDRDDALNAGVRALLDGRHPYDARTYLGNALSPLPGSLVMALPFVLIGNAAWQNVVWFGVWIAMLAGMLGDRRHGLAAAFLTLAVSPVVLQDLLTGGDLFVNSVVVLGAVTLTAVPRFAGWRLFVAAAAAGLAFSTRVPFALLLPLLAAFVYRRAGARACALYLSALLATAALVTLPFYLHDPAAFTPLATQNKFRFLAGTLPHADVWLPAVSAGAAVIAPLPVWRAATPWWLLAGAVVLILPVVLYAAVASATGETSLVTSGYGLPALVFGVPGIWMALASIWRCRENP